MLNVDEVAALYYDEDTDEFFILFKSGDTLSIQQSQYNAIFAQLSKLDNFISTNKGA